eukprot:COSAG02_NODE_2346_length_9092_cov_6.591460_4_plen_738_part_00
MEKASAAELANRKIVRRARRKKSAAPAAPQVKGLFGGVADNTAAKPPAPAATSAPSFKFGAATHQQAESPSATNAPSFKFGGAGPVASVPAAAPAFGFKFNTGSGDATAAETQPKESPAAKPAFKFGTDAAAPAAFAFKIDAPAKSAEPAAVAPKAGFSFNVAPPANTDDAESEDEQPEQETGTIVAGAGEEAETTEREHKAKLYRLRDGEWVEQGMGQLKLNRDNKSGKRRLLMRAGLRVVLNTPLFEGQMVKVQGAGILLTAAEVVEGVQSTASFLLKVNKEQLQTLADAIAAGHGAPSKDIETPKQAEVVSPVAQQNSEQPKQEQSKPVANDATPAAAPKPFIFKAPDAAAVMPATSNQPVFTFGGPTKLVQPTDEEMDEQEDSDNEGTSDESFAEEEVSDGEEDDEADEEEGEQEDPEEEEEEQEEEQYDSTTNEGGDFTASGLGAGLAMHVAEKEAAAAVTAESSQLASLPDQSTYRAQLEDYQNALEDWVQIAQREEKQRRALEEQLANAAAGGVPVTPRKQQATDNEAAAVAELQAQLAQVKADAEKKLGDLRTELETQQAAATRTSAEAEQLRQQNEAAQAEITKLKTPTKALVPVPKQEGEESDKIAALSQEVDILKKLFLASASASPAASEMRAQQQQQQIMPIPSPSKVLATPTAVRGSPHAIGSATKAANHSQHMHALNKQIASWVNSSLSDNPDADLTPQLKDYMNHVSGWQQVHNKWFRPSSN